MTLPTTAEVGPWAKEKLEALDRYLNYYTTILKNQAWCTTIYIDGFAGGGRSVIRSPSRKRNGNQASLLADVIDSDQQEVIAGSPRVALGLANPFDRYVFIDSHAERITELEQLKAEFSDSRQIFLRATSAADGIDWLLSQNISSRTHRGVAFLDPFGAQLEWTTIEKLAATGLFEVMINFALSMAIQRMLPNDAQFDPGWRERLDAYFGTADWFDEVYHARGGLFDDTGLLKRTDYGERLLALYRRRLLKAFGFVSTPRLICNTKGAPLYHLLWAGPHKKGLEGADHVLRMGKSNRLGRS